MEIMIYTDGACDIHAENQPGGWAAILQAIDEDGEFIRERVLSGGAESTTNNQMELTAVIEGLKALNKESAVTIVTDSRYVIDIARGTKKVVKNKPLWDKYFKLAEMHYVQWRYVAGHSGHALNERCDRLAVSERAKYTRTKSANSSQSNPAVATEIDIYLSTQIRSNDKTTAWAALILQGGNAREESGKLANTTEMEGTLIGAIASLETLPAGKSVTVHTAQEYLAKGMTLWLPNWAARRWKTRGGEPVEYQAHWRKLQQITAARAVHFHFARAREDNPRFQRGKEIAGELLNRD